MPFFKRETDFCLLAAGVSLSETSCWGLVCVGLFLAGHWVWDVLVDEGNVLVVLRSTAVLCHGCLVFICFFNVFFLNFAS